MSELFERRLASVERQLAALLAGVETDIAYSIANVSSPPTDAELDGAFDTPANLYNGFVGLVNDADGDANLWICYVAGAVWGYEQLTVAV